MPVEIPDYEDWIKRMSEAPELTIGTDNFKIFYENTVDPTKIEPNEQIHNFFEAYAFALSKLKKFSNLHKIEETCTDILKKRGQNQVVYNIRSRLKNSPDFFEILDFKNKGVYLIPKALRFKDRGGKYSSLIFDFDKGTVKMPEPLSSEIRTEPAIGEERKGESRTEPIKTLPPIPQENVKKPPFSTKSALTFSLIVIILIALILPIFSDSNKNAMTENYIIYSINNSNDEEGEFIIFYLINPDNIMLNSSIILPTDVYQSFSAEKGTFSSSFPPYSNYSIIRWKTNEDSKMKIYVNTFDNIPFELTLHNNSGRNVRLLGIDNFKQTKTEENIQWNFEIRRSR